MIVEKAYLELYPEAKLGNYEFYLDYSGKFNDYSGNVKKRGISISFGLSKKWETIGDEIKIGLIQHLFNKLFKTKIRTQNTDLYEIFLKKVHFTVRKNKPSPELLESFNRVNEKFFFGMIEQPNLVWGKQSVRKLGSYEYGSDTIKVSSIFLQAPTDLLDYLMYHEMLHKKHKFYSKNMRSYHHTGEFSKDEKKFPEQALMEKRLMQFALQHRSKRSVFRWF
jgi:hypothetical protein